MFVCLFTGYILAMLNMFVCLFTGYILAILNMFVCLFTGYILAILNMFVLNKKSYFNIKDFNHTRNYTLV